jgi:hypothetical protein
MILWMEKSFGGRSWMELWFFEFYDVFTLLRLIDFERIGFRLCFELFKRFLNIWGVNWTFQKVSSFPRHHSNLQELRNLVFQSFPFQMMSLPLSLFTCSDLFKNITNIFFCFQNPGNGCFRFFVCLKQKKKSVASALFSSSSNHLFFIFLLVSTTRKFISRLLPD